MLVDAHLFALIQMVWDRAEANGYALHMTTDPLPDTPTHQVMQQVAYSDHQVADIHDSGALDPPRKQAAE